jgi:hypothetical protein
MMQPANPIDFGGAVTPATWAKHAPQLDPASRAHRERATSNEPQNRITMH